MVGVIMCALPFLGINSMFLSSYVSEEEKRMQTYSPQIIEFLNYKTNGKNFSM